MMLRPIVLLALPFVQLASCAHADKSTAQASGLSKTCPAETFLATHGACVPAQWTCSPLYYAAGHQDGCDCDCGVPDPDCAQQPATFWIYGTGLPKKVESCP